MLQSDIRERTSGGWAEVGKLLVILTAIMAVRNSFGVFFTSIENQFSMSRGETSIFYSVFMALAAIFTILGGWALDRFGPRIVFIVMGILTLVSMLLTGQTTSSWQLFVTYSFLLAAGTGAAFSLVLATVSRWFVKRRGLALGIALSGEGVGTLIMAPVATFLIASFEWRNAYSIIGVFVGVLMIGIGLFLKPFPRNPESPGEMISSAGFSLSEAIKTRSFWFLGLVYLMFSLSFYLVLTHIVPHTTDLGIDTAAAAGIISVMGGCTIPGRLVMGWASDKFNRKMLAVFCALFQMSAMLWLAWSSSLWMFFVFAAAFGFAFGGLSNQMATLISDTFGMTNIGAITGSLVVGFTIGAAIGPILGGFVFDATSGYFTAFLVGSGAALLAVLFLSLIRRETGLKEK